MANGRFLAYYRVSTQKQGLSGLGLEAQQAAVSAYLNGGQWELVSEVTEVETGKGANALDRRPKLAEALAQCKRLKATLVIAKLDRLARNVHFISGLIESGVEFVAADMPHANKTMLQIHAVMSEHERDQISARTKAALAAAKARGVKLGNPDNLVRNVEERRAAADAFANKLSGLVSGMQARGMTQRAMVDELNSLGIKTARGGAWGLVQFQRVLKRITELALKKNQNTPLKANHKRSQGQPRRPRPPRKVKCKTLYV
jgi:DNA invertase Pin-like site-specific DNA recombinase